MPESPVSYAFLAKPDAERDVINAEALHRWLVGGIPTADSPYSPRELRLYVQQAREWLTTEIERKNKEIAQADFITRQKLEKDSYLDDLRAREDGAVPDEWIRSFTLPVLRDEARQEQYLQVPEAFLKLRRYQNLPSEEGIQSVAFVSLQERRVNQPFHRLSMGMATIVDRTGYGLMGSRGFQQEGDKVWLYRDRGQPEVKAEELEVKGIVRGSRTTSLPEPPLIAAAQDLEIQRYAREIALRRGKEDKLNDQNPTTP